jgi:hypothetical protein
VGKDVTWEGKGIKGKSRVKSVTTRISSKLLLQFALTASKRSLATIQIAPSWTPLSGVCTKVSGCQRMMILTFIRCLRIFHSDRFHQPPSASLLLNVTRKCDLVTFLLLLPPVTMPSYRG